MAITALKISEEDKILITRAYRRLLRSIKVDTTKEDKKMIRRAYELAVEAHQKQRRKSGEPYILHPIEVARICAGEIGLGPTAIVGALLHDVVEDTDFTLDEIELEFGQKICDIVDGLTKLDAAYNSELTQAENFKKVVSTLVKDVRIVLIKMSDRLHNMRTLGAMPRHKQLKIAAETSYIYAPLAHRLGLYNIKTEFNDLCMKILQPKKYKDIAKKLHATKRERKKYINEFIKPLRQKLDDLEMPYRILGRPKSISSIANKIEIKKVPFEEIYDLFAVRIIIDVPKEKEKSYCWQIYSTVTDVHIPIPSRLKDWVTTPKSNGYESLHTTVIGPKGRYVEVQIRSERMDEIAERGFAAHWKYKGFTPQDEVYDLWLDNIRELLEVSEGDALEFMSDFKTSLFKDEVYVYTPNGDMKILPRGATALDFAYSIHTELGHRCISVKVHNEHHPLNYKLQNGDQVEIITRKSQKPSEDWLKFVVTGRARSRIRHAIKEELRQKSDIGKETVMRKFRHRKINFEENIDDLIRDLDYISRPDFFQAVQKDEIDIIQVLQNYDCIGGKLVKKEKEKRHHIIHSPQPPKKPADKSNIFINGEPSAHYNFTLANCCRPVFGDDIFAFVTTQDGLKIHRTSCPNAEHLMANYAYRIMKADWKGRSSSEFIADLLIKGIDDGVGVIEKISAIISSEMGINIRSFSIEGEAGFFKGKMSLLVQSIDHLNKVMVELKNIDNINSVSRID